MYGVRKFFSPVLVSGVYNATQADALSVYITNDQPFTVRGDALFDFQLPFKVENISSRPYPFAQRSPLLLLLV